VDELRDTYASLSLSLVYGLSAGFLDILLSAVSRTTPGRFASFSVMLASLSASILLAFFFWTALTLLLKRHLTERRSLQLFVFLLTLPALLAAVGFPRYPLFPNGFLLASLCLLIALSSAAGVVLFMDSRSRIAKTFHVSLPFILGETVLLVWTELYHGGFPALRFGYCLAALSTLYIVSRASDKLRFLALCSMMISIVAGTFALPVVMHSKRNQAYGPNSKQRPLKHVILITVDTLRADALSCYGAKGDPTRNIDQLAGDGILFSHAFAPASWTWTAVVSIMTGYSPIVHQCFGPETKIPGALSTLAERMSKAGYFTAAFGQSGLLIRPDISRGFFEYHFYPQAPPDRSIGTKILDKLFPDYYRRDTSAEHLTELSTDWIASNTNRDFFLWIHYFDPHTPYDPPESYRNHLSDELAAKAGDPDLSTAVRNGFKVFNAEERKALPLLYRGEVLHLDDHIGKLMKSLKELGIYEESLIIFASDHGEEFWEHGGFEHGHSLYNEILRVPLILKLPGKKEGKHIDEMVSLESIAPTVLELSGVELRNEQLQSGTLVPLLKKLKWNNKSLVAVSTRFYDPLIGLLFDQYKYVQSPATGKEKLYDLDKDPGETESIVASIPDKAAEAAKMLSDFRKEAEELRKKMGVQNESAGFNEETEELLRSLGYIQ